MSLRLSKPVLMGGFVLLVLCGAYLPTGLDFLIDSIRSPWAHSFRGEPTLTGHWQGELVYSGIGKRTLTLEVRHEPKERRNNQMRYPRRGGFDGTAEIVDKAGNHARYEIWGSSNRGGSKVHINLGSLNRKSSTVPQPIFTELDGVWRGNTLELTSKYEMQLFDGKSNFWNSDWPSGTVSTTLSHQDYRDGQELKK